MHRHLLILKYYYYITEKRKDEVGQAIAADEADNDIKKQQETNTLDNTSTRGVNMGKK